MGTQTAEALEAMIRSASNPAAGTMASIIGLVAVFVAATGVFGEVQSAMNAIWKAAPQSTTLTRFMWARLSSLVVTSGFLLTTSLAVSAALAALSTYLNGVFPGAELALKIADVVISIFL
jgi:membrane protein